jgi:hypothetical protein
MKGSLHQGLTGHPPPHQGEGGNIEAAFYHLPLCGGGLGKRVRP